MSNYDRLVQAGVINPDSPTKPTPEELAKLETLSSTEVDHLIAIKGKLGDEWLQKHGGAQSFMYL